MPPFLSCQTPATAARLEIAGNTVRPRRPVSAAGLRRPETEYARQRKGFDPSPRYKSENVLGAELDAHEKGTEEYEGAGMVSKHVGVLTASIHVDDDQLVPFQVLIRNARVLFP